jgi:hypothetical protein
MQQGPRPSAQQQLEFNMILIAGADSEQQKDLINDGLHCIKELIDRGNINQFNFNVRVKRDGVPILWQLISLYPAYPLWRSSIA